MEASFFFKDTGHEQSGRMARDESCLPLGQARAVLGKEKGKKRHPAPEI